MTQRFWSVCGLAIVLLAGCADRSQPVESAGGTVESPRVPQCVEPGYRRQVTPTEPNESTARPMVPAPEPVQMPATRPVPAASRPAVPIQTTAPATQPASRPASTQPTTAPVTEREPIRDLLVLKQEVSFYLKALGLQNVSVSPTLQKNLDKLYTRMYFAPWHQERSGYPKGRLVARFDTYAQKPGYGENLRAHDATWLKALRDNADLGGYPNAARKAITIANTNLRDLPTQRPHFDGVERLWDFYPFDNLQLSFLPANTPVFIDHVSKDRAWFLVETPLGTGWVPVRDLAYVDKNFIRKWEIGQYIAITKNELPIIDQGGQFRFRASLGFIFPKAGESQANFGVRLAVADEQRNAMIRLATIRKQDSAALPVPLTLANIARLADEMMGQPYGWGGLHMDRDCSSMLRDLFTPFSVWLPRNSTDQAKQAGVYVDLSQLKPDEREQAITREGVPFLTLIKVRDPNHIMLYLGTYEGKPLVFHNFWGIRTRNPQGQEGRLVVGHSAITTLRPGAEVPGVDPKGLLLHRIEGMTIMVRSQAATTMPTTATTTTTAPTTTQAVK